jgi:hypothetical protein
LLAVGKKFRVIEVIAKLCRQVIFLAKRSQRRRTRSFVVVELDATRRPKRSGNESITREIIEILAKKLF